MINNKELEFLNNYTIEKQPTKEELQIKKLKLQIEEQEAKKQERQAKLQTQTKSTISKVKTILFYIILMPLLITGFFFIECARHSVRSGSRRR